MSLSTYYLEHGCHAVRLHRRRRRRRRRRAGPRAIPLAMITMRKSIPLLSMGMGLRLAAIGRWTSVTKFQQTFGEDRYYYSSFTCKKTIEIKDESPRRA